MKAEYEDRLQRAKLKLQEERGKRKSLGQLYDSNSEVRQDDTSCYSEASKTSRRSYASEYSRNSKKDTKGPRSEWRNKAMAVIERGRERKEEAELLREDASMRTGRSTTFKDREADVDSLVERNARLNERERLLKVESDLLDAAEAAARAENRARAEAYLGKDIHDEPEDEESLDSGGSATTSRASASNRAKRIREEEANNLNRSFHQAKAVWQVRCKDENNNLEDPTPIKSNIKLQSSRRKVSCINTDRLEDFGLDNPESPASAGSAKSSKSTKSSKSNRSFKSSRSSKSVRDEILYRSKKYEESTSPRSAKSEYVPQPTRKSPVVDMSLLMDKSDKQDQNKIEEPKRDFAGRRATSSYRQRLVDPLESALKTDAADEETSPRQKLRPTSASVSSYRNQNRDHKTDTVEPSDESKRQRSSASISSIRSKYSYKSKTYDSDVDDKKSASNHSPNHLKSSSSFSSNHSKHSVRSKHAEVEEDDDDDKKSAPHHLKSSDSFSSNRSKHSVRSKHAEVEEDDNDDMKSASYYLKSSASFSSNRNRHPSSSSSSTSNRSKHSVRSKARSAEVEEEDDDDHDEKSISNNSYHSRKSSSGSVSSRRSRRSYRSKMHDETSHGEDAENTLPEELSIPLIIEDLQKVENEPPFQRRELSYREKSALLAMENDNSENFMVEEGLSERYSFRQLGGQVKKLPHLSTDKAPQKKISLSKSKIKVGSQTSGKQSSATATVDVLQEKQKHMTEMDMTSLINENRELKARLQKERTRRTELDEKTTNLQLEVHQKGQEISQLKTRKDESASHKEQVYKLEDALQQTNRHLVAVVDENVKLRDDFEDERAKRCKAELQVKQLHSKLKKRSDEVVALARSMKAKEETYQRILLEERHLREVTESQLAKACHHINSSEQARDEDFEELEKQNLELRHAVKRMEAYLKQKFAEQNSKAGRPGRHDASQEATLERKPSMISEITTDYEYHELNHSQEGEI
jgi:hypothetical protein